LLYSQPRNITVLDKSTRLPLEHVSIQILETNQGTITNSEGNASIIVKANENIKISMLNYEEFILNYDEFNKTDTIFLLPKIFELDEVTVKSFNLKKALNHVLENYSKLYVDVPFEKECDFKEIFEIDGKLKRFISSKVNWWDKSYERKKSLPKFRLGEISYSKNVPFDIFKDLPKNDPSKSGYVELNSLIQLMYLNTLLNIIGPLIADSQVVVEDSPTDVTIVSFETIPLKVNSDNVTQKFEGKITFDKKTQAILVIDYEVIYQNYIMTKKLIETGKEYLQESKKGNVRLEFYKTDNAKLSLKTLEMGGQEVITYNNKKHSVEVMNKIYVLRESNLSKVNNSGLIDLKKPIYESLPSKEIKSTNSILLNTKEKEFMFGGN